jgi:hypothetical protein
MAAASAGADAPSAGDLALKRFSESLGGEAYALDAGRIAFRKRWETMLDDGLYRTALRGTWSPAHPAWGPARAVLSQALRQQAASLFAARREAVQRLLDQDSMHDLTEDERRQVTAFFESPGGRVFLRARMASAHVDAFGVPPQPADETLAQAKAARDAAFQALDALGEEKGEGRRIHDFLQSPVWKKVLRLQLSQWAETVAFFLNTDLGELLLKATPELAAQVRAATPGMPAPSSKTYLGTVAMAVDRSFTVVVEHYKGLSLAGSYTLKYAPGDLHWHDIAALVPDMQPAQTRSLYADAKGHVGDQP